MANTTSDAAAEPRRGGGGPPEPPAVRVRGLRKQYQGKVGDAFRGRRIHQIRLEGGDASSDSYCYS